VKALSAGGGEGAGVGDVSGEGVHVGDDDSVRCRGGNLAAVGDAAGKCREVDSGAVASGFTVSKGVTEIILSGGTAIGGAVSAGGLVIVESGGVVSSHHNSSQF